MVGQRKRRGSKHGDLSLRAPDWQSFRHRVLTVNSVHIMKKFFHHENTKSKKKKIYIISFSCFYPFVLS
jgi:hypothetical protein